MKRLVAGLLIGFVLGGAGIGLAAPSFSTCKPTLANPNVTLPWSFETSIHFQGENTFYCQYDGSVVPAPLQCLLYRSNPSSPNVQFLHILPSGITLYTGGAGGSLTTQHFAWAT
jgi:hypothetical protein